MRHAWRKSVKAWDRPGTIECPENWLTPQMLSLYYGCLRIFRRCGRCSKRSIPHVFNQEKPFAFHRTSFERSEPSSQPLGIVLTTC